MPASQQEPGVILNRYRKPLLGVASAIVIYAMLGFFLAPWLISRTAPNVVRENLGTELRLQDVAVNPFVLSLHVDGLELEQPSGDPFLTVDRIFINFQLSSLFRWAPTFREFHIESPQLYLARATDGELNVGFLAQDSTEPAAAEAANASGPPRLLIQDFAITDSVVNWNDNALPEPVNTQFGPINVAISELNTLPDRAGLQDVVITTESRGTLSWSGSLQLNPLRSEGRASIKGSYFPLTSAYLKHEIGFDIDDGNVDIGLDYRVDTRPDGSLEASVDNLEMTVKGLLVRTFNEALGRNGPDREVLRLPLVSLRGGAIRWPEKTVTASGFSIDGGVIRLLRDADGQLNVLPGEDAGTGPEEPEAEAAASNASADPWRLSLSRFNINRLALNLEDRSVEPAATVGWRSLDVGVQNISNEPGAAFPTTIMLQALDGGTITVDGQFTVLPDPAFDFDVRVGALEFGMVDPYVKQLADVHLESGALNVVARLHGSPDEPLGVSGDIDIVDFLITETDQDSRLGSWDRLRAENLLYSAAAGTVDISELRFAKPYGDILIAEDGSINLGRVRKGDGPDGQDVETQEQESADTASDEPGLDITIGRVVVSDAAADFADLSLPLPFSAQIAALNGEISTIATSSSQPSTVKMEGKVDEFGRVQVSGTVTPFQPAANTDLRVTFENVDMPKFSAYSIPFAGQEIASGRLDLDLGYALSDGLLAGENRVVLRDFELGEKVEHPGAMSLPLGLAVALLKDPSGRIDLDVPVRGDVNDPEFRYGTVVRKALVNLLTRIVTSPFALLGKLVGAEAAELEYIVFEPGRSNLSPPELEKAGKIAEALALRPELALQIGGVYVPASDAAALQADKVDQAIEARISSAKDDEAMYAEQRRTAIEELLAESLAEADSTALMDEVREAHTTLNDDGKERFDALAYVQALRERLIDAQPLDDGELAVLAGERAQQVRQAILAETAEMGGRIVIGESTTTDIDDDGRIRMKVRLSPGKDAPKPPAENAGDLRPSGSQRTIAAPAIEGTVAQPPKAAGPNED